MLEVCYLHSATSTMWIIGYGLELSVVPTYDWYSQLIYCPQLPVRKAFYMKLMVDSCILSPGISWSSFVIEGSNRPRFSADDDSSSSVFRSRQDVRVVPPFTVASWTHTAPSASTCSFPSVPLWLGLQRAGFILLMIIIGALLKVRVICYAWGSNHAAGTIKWLISLHRPSLIRR